MSGGKSFANAFLHYTFPGFLKWLWFRARGLRVVVTGECLQCGRCCHRLNLTRYDHWIRSEKEFDRMVGENPDYGHFKREGSTATGLLVFRCGKVLEDGACGDYENRPSFCRTFPEPDLYFMGAELIEGCGYRFEVVPSFGKMLGRELRREERARTYTPDGGERE